MTESKSLAQALPAEMARIDAFLRQHVDAINYDRAKADLLSGFTPRAELERLAEKHEAFQKAVHVMFQDALHVAVAVPGNAPESFQDAARRLMNCGVYRDFIASTPTASSAPKDPSPSPGSREESSDASSASTGDAAGGLGLSDSTGERIPKHVVDNLHTLLKMAADPAGTVREAIVQRANAEALAERVRELESRLNEILDAAVVSEDAGDFNRYVSELAKRRGQ